MKKIIIFSFFLILCNNTFAQSKEETQDWILSKLAKYVSIYHHRETFDFIDVHTTSERFWYKFFIEDGFLYIEFTEQNASTGNAEINGSSKLKKVKSQIPISAITKLMIFENSDSKSGKFLRIITEKEIKVYEGITLNPFGYKYVDIPYNFEDESDLGERFNKAFINLKKFYPKIMVNRPKELF